MQETPSLIPQVNWEQAIHEAGFGIAVVNTGQGSLLAVNRTFAEMHGYDPVEMIGKKIDDFVLSAPSQPPALPACPDGNRRLVESLHVKKDGTAFPVLTDLALAQSKNGNGSHHPDLTRGPTNVGCFLDVAELTHLDSSVRDSEERFRSLAAALPQLIWASNADGAIEYTNSLWRKYTGWADDQPMPPDPWTGLIHPEDHSPYQERWQNTLKSGEIFETQCRLKHMPDGTYRWFLCRAVPLRNAKGQVVRWFGSCTDIQDQMTNAAKLQAAIDALSRSNSDLEQFAYAASHDLQEPLRMVVIFTQLLKEEYSSQLDATAKSYLDFAMNGALRMEELLKSLLSYATIANAPKESAEWIDAGEACSAARLNLQAATENTGAVILCGPLPTVWFSRVHLVRLFQNLIGNALKYRRSSPPEVHISAQRVGDRWIFSIRDNGIGIAKEYLSQIFGVFKRLHGSSYEGAGIGLAICQKIVERAGGQIWAESEVGQGSTFHFSIPAVDVEANKQ